MKSTKRRASAGFALVAATAAVATAAMFGTGLAATLPSPTTAYTGGASVQAQMAQAAGRPAVQLTAPALRSRSAKTVATSADHSSGVSVAACVVGATSGTARSVFLGRWWLDYAGTCSRTRGQPRADALA